MRASLVNKRQLFLKPYNALFIYVTIGRTYIYYIYVKKKKKLRRKKVKFSETYFVLDD